MLWGGFSLAFLKHDRTSCFCAERQPAPDEPEGQQTLHNRWRAPRWAVVSRVLGGVLAKHTHPWQTENRTKTALPLSCEVDQSHTGYSGCGLVTLRCDVRTICGEEYQHYPNLALLGTITEL